MDEIRLIIYLIRLLKLYIFCLYENLYESILYKHNSSV